MTEFVEVDCSECGEPVETPRPIHTECLDFHVETPHPEDLERAIPESDLRELVGEWRRMSNSNFGVQENRQMLQKCADELEQVLEE